MKKYLFCMCILLISIAGFAQNNSFSIVETEVEYQNAESFNVWVTVDQSHYDALMPSQKTSWEDPTALSTMESIGATFSVGNGVYGSGYLTVRPCVFRNNFPWTSVKYEISGSKNYDPGIGKSATCYLYLVMRYRFRNTSGSTKYLYPAMDHGIIQTHTGSGMGATLVIDSWLENEWDEYVRSLYVFAYDMNDWDYFSAGTYPSPIPSGQFIYRDTQGIQVAAGAEVSIVLVVDASAGGTSFGTNYADVFLNGMSSIYVAADDEPISSALDLSSLATNSEMRSVNAGEQDVVEMLEEALQITFTDGDGTPGANEAATLSVTQMFTNPGQDGGNPTGYDNLADMYWTVSTGDNPGEYEIVFDLTDIRHLISNFGTLAILKRVNAVAPWQNVVDLGAAVQYDDPYITVSGLTTFSDFVVAGGGDNTLPVELSSFSATYESSGFVNLKWLTQSESDMLGYHVFRGTTNELNDAICLTNQIIPAKNQSTQNEYSHVDEDVEAGATYYYWLQSVDLDGSSDFHGSQSVTIVESGDEGESSPQVMLTSELYGAIPNPFNPEARIGFYLAEDSDVEVAIYDVRGRRVKQYPSTHFTEGNHYLNWDASGLSSGIFFIKLKTADKEMIKKAVLLK